MIPIQIASRDFPLTPGIRDFVRRHVNRLEKLNRRIQRCELTISTLGHRQSGMVFLVGLQLQLPGVDLVVSRQSEEAWSHESLRVVMRDAFRMLERRLEERELRSHGKARPRAQALLGTVTQIFPDYGFLESEDGLDVYFHRHSLKGVSLERLAVGATVTFGREEGERGPRATYVKLAEENRSEGRAA